MLPLHYHTGLEPPTINYVPCSSNFEDIVIIHPIDIDKCDINVNNENYTSPTKNEIHNAYFKQLQLNSKSKMSKIDIYRNIAHSPDVKELI